ncbi:MAG TPA: hypothetical protein VFW33_21745 [Gemmataceae bacterium]|nr:hypothetical protein [Gemmataceae bacterium]
MRRYLVCLAVTLLTAAPLCAGELDREFATKATPAPAVQKDKVAPVKASPAVTASAANAKGSELDAEAPADAGRGWHGGWGHGWRGGWGRGWGYGWRGGWGYGWRGGWGWGGWYRPWVGVGYYWPRYYSLGFSYYPGYVAYGYASPGWGYCW